MDRTINPEYIKTVYLPFVMNLNNCAGCGGEAVRRIAAFPPHPLRTRFSQRAVKRIRASVSEPHPTTGYPYAQITTLKR